MFYGTEFLFSVIAGITRQEQHVDRVNINPRGNPSIQFEIIVDHLLLSAIAPSTNTQYQHHIRLVLILSNTNWKGIG